MQQRNVALYIVLSLVTCGVFFFYWFIVLNDDANELSGDKSTPGVLALVFSLVTCGIYGLYWAYKMGDKIADAQRRQGMGHVSSNGVLYLVLSLLGLGILSVAFMQSEVNKLVAGHTPPSADNTFDMNHL